MRGGGVLLSVQWNDNKIRYDPRSTQGEKKARLWLGSCLVGRRLAIILSGPVAVSSSKNEKYSKRSGRDVMDGLLFGVIQQEMGGAWSSGLVTKKGCNLVDSASSHTLVSKIKPCMSKYKSFTLKLRTAHYISYSFFDSPLLLGYP